MHSALVGILGLLTDVLMPRRHSLREWHKISIGGGRYFSGKERRVQSAEYPVRFAAGIERADVLYFE